MIKEIIRKEILENIVSFKFQFIFISCFLLTLASFLIMVGDYQKRYNLYTSSKEDPNIIVLPPNILSIFVKGYDENITSAFEIDYQLNMIKKKSTVRQINVIFSLFSTPDFFFISEVIFSLIIILFSFNAVSQEREEGTLQLIFSNSISRSTLLIGKIIGRMLIVNIPICFSFITGILLIILFTSIHFAFSDIIRLLILIFFTQTFLFVFFLLGIMISIASKKSFISLIILLFIWNILIFAVPNLSSLVAKGFSNLPSEQYFRQMRVQQWVRVMFLNTKRKEGSERWQKIFKELADDEEKLWDNYEKKSNKLIETTEKLIKLSPLGCYIDIATAITNTSIRNYILLKNQIFNFKKFSSSGEFYYKKSTLSESFSSILASISILLLLNLVLFLISIILFIKLDVRWN